MCGTRAEGEAEVEVEVGAGAIIVVEVGEPQEVNLRMVQMRNNNQWTSMPRSCFLRCLVVPLRRSPERSRVLVGLFRSLPLRMLLRLLAARAGLIRWKWKRTGPSDRSARHCVFLLDVCWKLAK
jgi:hypothetical protein